jgi:CRISPR-associated protein Csh1
MLREIIKFTQSLSAESFKRGLQPTEGVHIQVKLSEDGKLQEYEKGFFKKGDEVTPFLQDCLNKEISSKYVSINKALDSRKKIHSCSPFCVAFKKKTMAESQTRLEDYFNAAMEYCESDSQRVWAEKFRNYCIPSLNDLLERVIQEIETTKDNGKNVKVSDNHYIYVYLANVSLQDYEQVHQNYIRPKAFNKDEFNREINGTLFGVSDYLTGYNQKKPFLQHLSATFDVNERVTADDAVWLFKFAQLKANKQLPNPLPIFIEKEELNDEVVKVFHRDEDKRIGYAEMIRAVYEKENDLGNYYLLNIQGNNVKDFDFVSSFQFKIDPAITVGNLFAIGGELYENKIDDIFDFERKIISKIFDGQLVRKRDDGWWLRYFDDIENKPQYIRAAMFQLVLKYRKSFYDYIYKSKREAVTAQMFRDIMQTGILDNIQQDEFRDNKHTKGYAIKEKLNIWFSLYEFFGNNKTQTGETKMANQIQELQQRMQEIVADADAHLETDAEFAYAAGQVIYYLLSCSEAGNKTHALLEPYLQKTDVEQFKLAISRTFAQYKHAISFYKGRFEKLMSDVLAYEPEKNLKSLLPMILAGYFAESVIYQKREKEAVES